MDVYFCLYLYGDILLTQGFLHTVFSTLLQYVICNFEIKLELRDINYQFFLYRFDNIPLYQGITKMETLPIEIWSLIFKELPLSDLQICRLVCTQWNSVIKIRNKTLRLLSNEVFQIGFHMATTVLPLSTITELYLTNITLQKSKIEGEWSNTFFANLSMLTLDNCEFEISGDLVHILQKCSNLKNLFLNYIKVHQDMLNNSEEQNCLKLSLRNVSKLVLKHCKNMTDIIFNRLVACMENLNTFEITRHSILTKQCILNFIQSRADMLKSLVIDVCFFDEARLWQLAKMPKLHLKILWFDGYARSSVNDEILLELLQKQKVVSLKLPGCHRPLNNLLPAFKEMSHITKLCMDEVFFIHGTLTICLQQLTNLISLSFSRLFVWEVKELRDALRLSHSGRKLKYLRLSKSTTNTNVFYDIIELAPNLTSLILDHCLVVSKHHEEPFLFPKLKYLKTLMMKNCYEGSIQFKRERFFSPKLNLGSLICLILSDTLVNDHYLFTILEKNRRLRQISLESCKCITDKGFMGLTNINQSLETIILRRTKITDSGLMGMLQNSKRLLRLDLSHCEQITKDSVMQIKYFCPHLLNLCVDKSVITSLDTLLDSSLMLSIHRAINIKL